MKRLALIALAIYSLTAYSCGIFGDSCSAGDMRCDGNIAQMCSADNKWEIWQDCSAVGESCGNGPSVCSGFDVACCR